MGPLAVLPGFSAHEKAHPPGTLQWAHAQDPALILGGGRFLLWGARRGVLSYERGAPVITRKQPAGVMHCFLRARYPNHTKTVSRAPRDGNSGQSCSLDPLSVPLKT